MSTRRSRRQTNSLIPNFHEDVALAGFDRDPAAPAAGMAVNVSKGFLDDAEDSDLKVLSQAAQVRRVIEEDFDPGTLAETRDVGADRGIEPQLIQKRWMEQVRESPDFLEHSLRKLEAVGYNGT